MMRSKEGTMPRANRWFMQDWIEEEITEIPSRKDSGLRRVWVLRDSVNLTAAASGVAAAGVVRLTAFTSTMSDRAATPTMRPRWRSAW
jgi:hypothetical protein